MDFWGLTKPTRALLFEISLGAPTGRDGVEVHVSGVIVGQEEQHEYVAAGCSE